MTERFTITGFADEVSPELQVQVDTLSRLNIVGVDLRSVYGTNVLDLSADQLHEIHDAFASKGIFIQSIGSPVNKIPYDVMKQGGEFDKLKKAIKAAEHVNVKRIRVFTPEAPQDQHDALASKIISWMSEQRVLAEDHGMLLIHENDAKYWGAYPTNAKRLFENLGSNNFKAVFDFANTVLLGFDPLDDWFPWVLPYLDTLHIKDASRSEQKVVPAGEGDGRIVETLKYLIGQNWTGPLTLEPHLQSAGQYGGYSGDRLFEVATNALRSVIGQAGG
jgi:sugar phosphate isomerase/epimerase